ncbi:hypothetical protein JCM21900_003928 [Sporobolomyces salmonicolor]
MPAKRTRQVSPDTGDEPLRAGFHDSVYRKVRQIPEGKVASYGMIAKLIGHPRHSRMVGTALKCLPSHMAFPYLPFAPAPVGHSPSASNASSSSYSPPTTASTSYNGDLDVSPSPDANADVFAFPFGDRFSFVEDVQPAPQPNPDWVPWHRVVSSTGVISPRGNDRAVLRQADYLVAEGVEVRDGPRAAGGEPGPANPPGGGGVDAFGLGGASGGRVSMAKYGWSG